MKYFSTRDNKNKVTASQAIVRGLATDGGLYVPQRLPGVTRDDIASLCKMHYRQRACAIMKLFLDEFDQAELESYVNAAYSGNYGHADIAPLHFIDDGAAFLELWHGPTCAFKDMALQMLPYLLAASLRKNGEQRQVCILVATSGDTGKAALEGFKDVPGTKILVFYPRDGVSDVQRLQMVTQDGENVHISAVIGNFDDAQAGVKAIFSDPEFAAELDKRGYFLSSANSINWGRLLPQIVYYFSAYCDYVNSGRITLGDEINFCVPTGNFGNILAGWYAKRMGLPVKRLICASNENNVLTDFITTGVYDRNRPFYLTASPSMDILVSSNLERLLYGMCQSDEQVAGYMSELAKTGKYTVSAELKSAIGADFSAGFCDDGQTKAQIAEVFCSRGYLMDTHTAVAYKVLCDYRARTGDAAPAVVVSTASPFKFCDSVLEALGRPADAPGTELIDKLAQTAGESVPKPLAGLGERTVRFDGFVEKEKMPNVVEHFLA